MLKANLYNQKGEIVGEVDLNDQIFNIEPKGDILHQVYISMVSSSRINIASVKDRSEVRGGGRKPWRQKGTGRARHGSIRSPLWRGGGVTFGPQSNRNFFKKINKKLKRKAMLMALSSKLKDNEIILLDRLVLDDAKTKMMATVMGNFSVLQKKNKKFYSTLLTIPNKDEKIYKSARNLENLKLILAKDLNLRDLLEHKFLIMPQESIKVIEKTFLAA